MSADTHRLLPTLSPSFLVSSSISMRRPASTTVKPAFISASDAARPTPVPAPVTIAILFVASAICFLAFTFLLLFRICRVVLEYSGAPRATPPTSASAGRGNRARPPEALRRLEHGRRVHQRLDIAGGGVFDTFGQCRQHRLADRQMAGAGNRHDALAGF